MGDEQEEDIADETAVSPTNRLLKNLSQQPVSPGQGWPDEIMRFQALDFGSAAKTTLFESDVEKDREAFFNILLKNNRFGKRRAYFDRRS